MDFEPQRFDEDRLQCSKRLSRALYPEMQPNPPATNQSTAPRASYDSHQTTPWTATRCHRLLRPLLAHIASLRKERLPAAGESSRNMAGKRGRGARHDGTSSAPEKRRKIMTYSSRASRSRVSQEAPEEPSTPRAPPQQRIAANRPAQPIALPTPFLRRVRNHEMSSPLPAPEAEPDVAPPVGRTYAVYSGRLRLLHGKLSPERLRLQESVLHALDVLLAATSPRRTVVAAPRSLMAMCLRKVPEAIAQLELWEQKEAHENGTKSTMRDSQISMDVYSDLESLGATDGWRHLCLVVRAHGLRIVQEAVQERLFDDAVTELLLVVCGEHLPLVEFQDILDSFIFRQYPGPTSEDDCFARSEALRPLAILKSVVPHSHSFRMRKLGELLASGMLPSKWTLSLDITQACGQAVLMLAKSTLSEPEDVTGFMAIVLEQYCRLESAQRQEQPRVPEGGMGVPGQFPSSGKTIKSLAWAVASIASVPLLAKEVAPPTEAARAKIAAYTERTRLVLETSISNIRQQQPGRRHRISSYALNLGAFLALDSEDAGEAIRVAWKGGHARAETPAFLHEMTTTMVGTIAFFLSRAAPATTHRPLSQLSDKLGALDLPNDPASILMHSAVVRAEISGGLPDLAYAESLPTASGPSQYRRRNAPEEGTRSVNPEFVWDDGMGEWTLVSMRESVGRTLGSIQAPSRLLLKSSDECRLTFTHRFGSGRGPDAQQAVGREVNDPLARSFPTTRPPRRPISSRTTQLPRQPVHDSSDSDAASSSASDSEDADVNDSFQPPPPRSTAPRPTRGRPPPPPAESSSSSSSSSSDDDDELGQDQTSSGTRPLRAGRVAAVRTQAVVRRSASLMSLVGSDSSSDELSFA